MTAHDPGETSDAAFAPELSGESASRPPGRRQLASTLADGYRASSPAEQAGFGMTVGFALALAGARKITYIQERRRGMPVLRGLARGRPRLPRSDDVRVHHYLPGLAIAMTAGGTAILGGSGGIERYLSVPFGIGTGLVVDEIGLLTGRNNPYWGAERFVILSCLAATSAAAAMAAGFLRRGWHMASDLV